MAKRRFDPYLPEQVSWLKVRNQNYRQWVGREELFERERGSDPGFQVWDGCALACEGGVKLTGCYTVKGEPQRILENERIRLRR